MIWKKVWPERSSPFNEWYIDICETSETAWNIIHTSQNFWNDLGIEFESGNTITTIWKLNKEHLKETIVKSMKWKLYKYLGILEAYWIKVEEIKYITSRECICEWENYYDISWIL